MGLVFLSAHFLLIVDMIYTTLKRWDSISGYVLSTSSSSSQVLVIPGKHQMFCSADSEWGIICDFWVAHLCPCSTQICGTCMSIDRRALERSSNSVILFSNIDLRADGALFLTRQQNNKKNSMGSFVLKLSLFSLVFMKWE